MQHIEVPDIDPPPLIRENLGFTFLLQRSEWYQVFVILCQQSFLFHGLLLLQHPKLMCHKPLHIFHWSRSMCNYINHFILFFSAQAIIWSVWSNSFLLFFQFFIHCSRMGICTSLITSYTTLGCFCYLLGFHLCNIFTLMVSNYYKL